MLTLHIGAEREVGGKKGRPASAMLDQPFVMNLKVKTQNCCCLSTRLPGEETDCSGEEL